MTPGYILNIPKNRQQIFSRYTSQNGKFAEPVTYFTSKKNYTYLVFICQQGFITHVGAGKGGNRAGSAMKRLNVERVRPLPFQISFQEVVEQCSPEARKVIGTIFIEGGLVSENILNEIVKSLTSISPKLEDILQSYLSKYSKGHNWTPSALRSLVYQKEAILTALHLADLDRSPLKTWSAAKEGGPSNFLGGLDQVYLREDQMINSDLNVFPGFNKMRESKYSRAQFRSDDRKITLDVLVANRTRLEEQTGVDLIYYNGNYRSFVLVQYKAMEVEVGAGDVFRLPDAQLMKEIATMDLLARHLGDSGISDHRDYRLTYTPFFIKLCSRLVFEPNNIDLTKGMYINLDHWKMMEGDKSMVGIRGGQRIIDKNVERYINNSEFAFLVKHSWIGTTAVQSLKLEKLIEEILKTGRSVVYAVKRDTY